MSKLAMIIGLCLAFSAPAFAEEGMPAAAAEGTHVESNHVAPKKKASKMKRSARKKKAKKAAGEAAPEAVEAAPAADDHAHE